MGNASIDEIREYYLSTQQEVHISAPKKDEENMKDCKNCHEYVLYGDEVCSDCGREGN